MINEIKEDIKDIRCRVEGTLNTLKDGKEIVTYDKLLGIRDKMARLAIKIENLSKKDNNENNNNK